RAFALYVAGYTAGRFWIELMRTDPATMIFGLRINVITSAVVFIAAVIYLATAPRGREEPDALAERKEPALAS
ncbi:MAG: prolipoprotein diacylglyceryl transferase, partial [Actinomycetota bacterium]|nr:prolipoprotein diacylglyceryl transferase [Actinomycetota bacterium]